VLDLPEQPWIPGAGVPFDAPLAAGLERLDPELDPGAWRRALELLLGPAPAGAVCPAAGDALPSSPRTK
jgi:hypothetical protein